MTNTQFQISRPNSLNQVQMDQIMTIWLAGNLDGHSFIDRNYWISSITEVRHAIQESVVYTATIDSQIVGFLGIVDTYAAGLFVDRKYRDNGIGTALFKRAIADYKTLTLHVYEKNPRAFELYKRLGFKIVSKQIDGETGEVGYTMKI
ncbi:GNAT family N-acetyltransferase [Lentilactobacillus sp. Marseille-Q4993]|uniref:GNAT family N-acetyltransferase n=1 Tax=Lentilactobacillus sp. Marseille-Q4993 TaxID=3039492 RepID=UPI0024BC1391|nr:GNAT family N-acetyltransferase [Lentilactobacillus sp. Marseille-Q4993]